MSWRVEVDADKCTGDEECVNVCPVGVFEMQDDKATVVAECGWICEASSKTRTGESGRLSI